MIAHSGFTRAGRPAFAAAQAHLNPSSPPVPATAAPASVPMAMHLEHLEITAAASRNFWFPIGVMTGFVLFLAGAYLHNLRILP